MEVQGESFAFEGFVLVPDERLLFNAGRPVHLTGKAFDLLVLLVRRSGHLVTKSEMLRELWPDIVVEEVNLTVNVSAVRKALDRERAGKSLIATVPKCGYRFVAPVVRRGGGLGSHGDRVSSRPLAAHGDAYRAYLQGRHEWSRRSESGLLAAAEHFRRAIDIDPQFAAAHSGLSDCYATLGYLSFMAPAEAFPVARRYALRALDLDRALVEAHASLAFVNFYFDWNWKEADRAFKRAIELDPTCAPTHQWYSIYLLAAGRRADSEREIELAREYDPLSLPINSDLGFHYYYAGLYDEAVKQLEFVLEINPDFAPAHLWLGRTYQELGRIEDAVAEFLRVESHIPGWPVSIAARGFLAGSAGFVHEARELLAALKRLANRRFVTPYGIALVHAGLNENDAALAWLKTAFNEKSHWLVWLRLDPRWKVLRPTVQFAALDRLMDFPGQI